MSSLFSQKDKKIVNGYNEKLRITVFVKKLTKILSFAIVLTAVCGTIRIVVILKRGVGL